MSTRLSSPRPVSLVFILLMLFMVNTVMSAQDSLNSDASSKDDPILRTYKRLPILNGFRFIPSDIVRDPFINTFIKLNFGGGTALDLQSYIRNIKGEVLDTLSGDITYISAEIEFQYAVNDWLSFNAIYGGNSRLGTNAYTLLTTGISYTSGYTLGSKIRIWQSEKMLLSGSAEYSSTDVTQFSIYEFAKDVYESGGKIDSTTSSIITEDVLSKMFANVNYAWAPTNWLGFLGIAGFGAGEVFQGKRMGIVRLGAGASIDFANFGPLSFPIGILGSVRYNSYSESGEKVNNLFIYGLRIGYTGHKDFDIGIENTYQNLKYLKNDQMIQTIVYAFKMRYYF
jgi:hypothetical protein